MRVEEYLVGLSEISGQLELINNLIRELEVKKIVLAEQFVKLKAKRESAK